MKPKRTPTFRRVLKEVFPDMPLKTVVRLLELGVLRVPDDAAINNLVTAFGAGGEWPARRVSDSEMTGE